MSDSEVYEPWAKETTLLLDRLMKLTGRRVSASIIPETWSDDQAKRLSRCVNRVLEAGEAGLKTIEDALHG